MCGALVGVAPTLAGGQRGSAAPIGAATLGAGAPGSLPACQPTPLSASALKAKRLAKRHRHHHERPLNRKHQPHGPRHANRYAPSSCVPPPCPPMPRCPRGALCRAVICPPPCVANPPATTGARPELACPPPCSATTRTATDTTPACPPPCVYVAAGSLAPTCPPPCPPAGTANGTANGTAMIVCPPPCLTSATNTPSNQSLGASCPPSCPPPCAAGKPCPMIACVGPPSPPSPCPTCSASSPCYPCREPPSGG